MKKFTGTDIYIATRELQVAVNAAIHLQKPLLVKGEPGTGKTLLAHEIAKALNKEIITWHIKSTTVAQQGLYEYDAVSRLRDSQLGNEKVNDIANYIKKGKLWEAFDSDEQKVLLIDEIDKADIEFPNDLLLELDKMEFYVYELQKTIRAKHRPIVIITSNNEKDLPDAFLRRCVFHFIRFPDKETMQQILDVHFPGLKQELMSNAMKVFYDIRAVDSLKKKPSTSELIDWLRLLIHESYNSEDLEQVDLRQALPPASYALLKNEQDLETFSRIQKRNYRN
jgi:MoxR-like ATPase